MADRVNESFLVIAVISVVLLGLVTFSMIFLAMRYRRKKNPHPEDISGSILLEIVWTVIPSIIVFIMFWYGWKNFESMRKEPEGAMMIHVTARMWSWNFEYDNGLKSGKLRVPAGRPVKLIMESEDVLHSLFIPAFKIKEDVVPVMKTKLWFTAPKPGEYDLFCAEYCGRGHSSMTTKVIAMTGDEFTSWYESSAPAKKKTGAMDVLNEYGCLDCHSTDGSEGIGPTFRGIFGHSVTVITDGNERDITVDGEYLTRSILKPDADVVRGYSDIMPSFEGEISESEIQTVIEYIRGLK